MRPSLSRPAAPPRRLRGWRAAGQRPPPLAFQAVVRPSSPVAERPTSAELLRGLGVQESVLQSAIARCPELLGSATADRVDPIVRLLAREGFGEPHQLDRLLLKCPQLPTYCIAKAEASLCFLSDQLGLDPQQRAEVVRRFPQVLGYGSKSWLQPQLAFLRSLGVAQEDLPALVMARPQVLGSHILLVTRWLTRYVKVPRHQVGAVLHAYPLDYSAAFAEGLRKWVASEAARLAEPPPSGEADEDEREP